MVARVRACRPAGIGPAPGGTSHEEEEMSRLSDADRSARREADRQKAREAAEGLKTSDGWTRWLALRRRFHAYTLLQPAAHRVAEARRDEGRRLSHVAEAR